MVEPWLLDLKQRQAQLFSSDWVGNVRSLNARFNLTGRHAFVESRWPPLWFQGDIETIEPGKWVAILSLNPKTSIQRWLDWLENREFTAESYWDYLRHVNLESLDYFNPDHAYFYWRFDRKLVHLIAHALGEPIPSIAEEAGYKRLRMRSFEAIPYASHEFQIDGQTLREMLTTDEGCRFNLDLALAMIERGHPAAVLLNGRGAVETFAQAWPGGVELAPVQYQSESNPVRMLTHWEGWLQTAAGPIPVVGFRQLGRASHPSNADIALLGRHIARIAGAPIVDQASAADTLKATAEA